MALKRMASKNTATTPAPEPAAAVTPAPEPAAAVTSAPEPAAAVTPAPEPAAAANVPATRPVAALPTVGKGSIQILWEDKRDLFVAKFGELPRLTASNGNVMDNEKKLLGSWVELQILSFNQIFIVGPCDNNAPSDLVRYSYDNLTFPEDPTYTVANHINALKENEWPNAASKEYYEVVAVLRDSERPTEHKEKMVQLQLSPTSVTSFEGYRKQTAFQIALGNAKAETADLTRAEVNVVSSKGNTWSKFAFKPSAL